ncbi:MAG: CvpA family protein [Deltaproteobacteria bacterium]|nr:CvpA family protein [Deltaproteobacteria bacterium]
MTLDLACASVVLIFALLGYYSGFAMQVMRLVVLVVSYLLAGLAGKPLGPWLASNFGVPVMLGKVMGTAAAFLIIYSILGTVGWSFIRRRRKKKFTLGNKPVRASWDSWMGALFGGAKVGFILFVILSAVVLLGSKTEPALKRADIGYEKSKAVAMARKHNLLASMHLPVVGDLATLQKLSDNPQYRQKAMADPNIRKLINHPKIRRLLGDRSVIEASRKQDVAGLMGNPKINKLLEDPEILELLEKIDLSKIK